MFDVRKICPYTGLRSFSEEESLYFKGREEDIDQASSQLQRNKFLMLTGASGDGKSSLIYAGIIPNARAGFLKSKYTNWCVADFRPERSPFQNLCKAISRELEIPNAYTVQSELNHGFSSLVDLYKNSNRYVDTNSFEWENASPASKSAMRQKAANLVILVDQFEEFFTNPENYHHGAPSKDSNLVVNILLETARIALEEDLPIFIIFTMRSDYTGQCAAFRGLPEYIGFSQFFVPHLNRSQLQQVIEEPAVLNGDRITRRLTERLILDLTEGVDQLPILQHALNQIWLAANNGEEELDLIHYAMVGGMSVDELPDGEAKRFAEWFDKLPPEIKLFYTVPSLQNVLDTHTNKLYINAARYYNQQTGKVISTPDAQLIIKTVFTCLTKIDQGRAVRNRMTLDEITHILGNPGFSTQTVGAVINSFREPGNTFIRPFINPEYPESMDLQAEQVLDITHESLIRNWQYLGQWAKEEFDSYSIYVDYEQQLKRWVNSGKSGSFLLPIGPLTFFESWYRKAKPNSWWVARYLPEETTESGEEQKLQKASDIVEDANEFLSRSAGKHAITRSMMRFGSRKIAASIGIIALITLSSFVVKSYLKKQNSHVLSAIHDETLSLVNDPKVTLSGSSMLIIEQLKLGMISLKEIEEAISDSIRKINVINGIGAMLTFQGHGSPKTTTLEFFEAADSLLEAMPVSTADPVKLGKTFSEINDFRSNTELAYFYTADSQVYHWKKKNADRSARWALKTFENQPAGFTNMLVLTISLENALNYRSYSDTEVGQLIKQLSPFENGLQSAWLKANFDPDKLMQRGSLGYGYKFNGLFQELAYLYAAAGKSDQALRCVDSLLKYSENNFQGDYSLGVENAGNIALIFHQYGNDQQLKEFVSGYCNRTGTSEINFYQRLLARMIPCASTTNSLDLFWFMEVKQDLNVFFANRADRSFITEQYREIIRSGSRDSSERNFLLAISYKDQAILNSINKEAALPGELTTNQLFNMAVSFYQKTGKAYLEQQIFFVGTGTIDEVRFPRRYQFLYPDIRTVFHPGEPRSFFFYYLNDEFLRYILNNNLFQKLYANPGDLNFLNGWLTDFHSKQFEPNSFIAEKPGYEVLRKLSDELDTLPGSAEIDLNLLYLYLGAAAQQSKDSAGMLHAYRHIQKDNLVNVLRSKEYAGFINDQAFRLIGKAIKGLSVSGHYELGHSFITVFKNPVNRSSLYSYVALSLARENYKGPLSKQFADSATLESSRVKDTRRGQPNRPLIAAYMPMEDPAADPKASLKFIKNLPDKFGAICGISRSYAFHKQLYQATVLAPQFLSRSDKSFFLWSILYDYSKGENATLKDWAGYDSHYVTIDTDFIRFLDEDN